MRKLGSSALRHLLSELLDFKRCLVIVFFLGIVISAIQPVTLKISQKIIDALQSNTNPSTFGWVIPTLVLVFVISGLAKFAHNSLRRYVSQRIIITLRERLFHRVLNLPLPVLDKKKTGEMLSNLQNDLAQMNVSLDTICDLFKEPITFMGLIGVAFYANAKLTLVTLVVAPLVILLFSWCGRAVKRYSQRNLENFSDLVSLSQETMIGSRVVRVFQLEKILLQHFKTIQTRYFNGVWRSVLIEELATPLVELIGACLMASVVVYGGHLISHHQMTTGQLLSFIFAIGLSQMPIKKLNNAYLKLKIGEAAAERVYAILEINSESVNSIEIKDNFERDHLTQPMIIYENVGLSYEDNRVLNQVSFEVNEGECVGFVGVSGSGKTSLVNLLPRLYEVTSGRILIKGRDIRSMTLSGLREHSSFVTQETFLFNETIFENIRYGRLGATHDDILRAAEQAHCMNFIKRAPKGFDTIIGERGLFLSGGERQRIAIARSFLKNAPILVLDEATSNLDSESEKMVQAALETLMVGKTSLIVAHRFSSLRMAKKIFVIDRGEITEVGCHDDLLSKRGTYSRLYEQQHTLPLSV